MCLILLALDAHPSYGLVLAANRDEFHDRPAARAAWWPDAPDVIGGRDLREGGTWMAVTRRGRWAALTNVRGGAEPDPRAPSRGVLVRDYVMGTATPEAYLRGVAEEAGRFNGFNLLVGEAEHGWWFSNRSGEPPLPLGPGIHGVSNHLLDTPWPKVARGKRALAAALHDGDAAGLEDALLALLADRTTAPDAELPDTGVGVEWERALSPALIRTPGYGTRASTALLLGRSGEATLVERVHAPQPGGAAAVAERDRVFRWRMGPR